MNATTILHRRKRKCRYGKNKKTGSCLKSKRR